MKQKTIIIVAIILLVSIVGALISTNYPKEEQNETTGEFVIKFSNETPEIWYYLSENYRNITINGEVCEEVPCECHKNNPSCALICYYCEEVSENR